MSGTLRGIGAVVAGFVAASMVMMLVEYTNGHVFYPELGKSAEGVTDPVRIKELMASVPLGAMLVVLGGWILGATAGGWVAKRIAGEGNMRPVYVLGLLLTCGGIANNLMLPPPLWFWIAGMLVLLPFTIQGARWAGR